MRIKILTPLVIAVFFTACGVNEDQRNFEAEALSPPGEITEMTATGVPAEGEDADESDWRISPEFSGLVRIQTAAYPNPVQLNGTVSMDLYVNGIQAVNGLQVYVYQPNINTLSGPIYIEGQPLDPGFTPITLKAVDIAGTETTSTNLYRIVIYDGTQNIITYGDIKVL